MLCQAVKAMELEDDEHKKESQAKDEQILSLQQNVEMLEQKLQVGHFFLCNFFSRWNCLL